MASKKLDYSDGPEEWADAFISAVIAGSGVPLERESVISWFQASLRQGYKAGFARAKYEATYYHGAEY